MTASATLTETQKRLLAGAKKYFFEACFSEFSFLPAAGFRRSFEHVGRNCYLVLFVKEDAASRLEIRIYHEDTDALWCDLVCTSNEVLQIRLAGRVDSLGTIAPDELLDAGPVSDAACRRIHELAAILRQRWAEFHERLLVLKRQKEANNFKFEVRQK